jgi:hypothetical protein
MRQMLVCVVIEKCADGRVRAHERVAFVARSRSWHSGHLPSGCDARGGRWPEPGKRPHAANVAPGAAVTVRPTYVDRPCNEVTVAVQ